MSIESMLRIFTSIHTHKDRGALSFIDVLTVVATDVNDLNPAFDLQQYAVDVHENLTYVRKWILLD